MPQGAACASSHECLRSEGTLPSMNSLVPFQNLLGDCFLIGSIPVSSSLLEKQESRGSQKEKFCQCGCVSLCNSSQKLLLWFSLEQPTVYLEDSCLVLCLSLVAQASARVAEGAPDHETGPGRSQHGQGSPSAGDQEVRPPVPALTLLGTGNSTSRAGLVISLPNRSNSRTETSCDCRDWAEGGRGLAETNERNEEEFALFWPGSAALSQGMVSPRAPAQVQGGHPMSPHLWVLSASSFCDDIWRWSMPGFLLLSPFLVVFLPSCARQGPQQEQGGHFSTWAVTGQGGRKVRALLGEQGCCHCKQGWDSHWGARAHSSLFPQEQGQDSTEIPTDSLSHQ